MRVCSNCGGRLAPILHNGVRSFRCVACGARATTFEALRQIAGAKRMGSLWAEVSARSERDGRACPLCRAPMVLVPIPTRGNTVAIDVCASDRVVWFDPGELEDVVETREPDTDPMNAGTPEVEADSGGLRRSEAADVLLSRVQTLRKQQARQEGAQGQEPSSWRALLAYLGLPIETAEPVRDLRPVLTWGLTGLLLLLGTLGLLDAGSFALQWGFDPSSPTRHSGITLISYGLLAGGVVPLLLSAYFVFTFGDNVEAALGRLRLSGLLLATLLGGALLHLAFPAAGVVVTSGGLVTALLTFYALRYPRARLGVLVAFRGVVRIPAWVNLAGWIILQGVLYAMSRPPVTLSWLQLDGLITTSGPAQFAGLLSGWVAWLIWHDRR